jgi:fructose-bisphosphate aldolase, class I
MGHAHMNGQALVDTAQTLIAGGRGLLATDESTCELGAARLNALDPQARSKEFRLPWPLPFSFARAIQHPALNIGHDQDAILPAVQQGLLHHANGNWAAARSEYNIALEPT